MEPFVHGFLPSRLGDTSRDYAEWRARVLQVLFLPEYKLRKLWKLNFSPKDIELNRHHEVFPPAPPRGKRLAPGRDQNDKRGRAIGAKKVQWLYAKALQRAAASMLAHNRMQPELRIKVQKDLEQFSELVRRFKAK